MALSQPIFSESQIRKLFLWASALAALCLAAIITGLVTSLAEREPPSIPPPSEAPAYSLSGMHSFIQPDSHARPAIHPVYTIHADRKDAANLHNQILVLALKKGWHAQPTSGSAVRIILPQDQLHSIQLLKDNPLEWIRRVQAVPQPEKAATTANVIVTVEIDPRYGWQYGALFAAMAAFPLLAALLATAVSLAVADIADKSARRRNTTPQEQG